MRWELNNWIFPFALKVEEESFTWTRLGERAGNWWNNGLQQQQQYCSACNSGGTLIYLWRLPVGGGWALCRGLESPPLLFLPLQSWFGGGVIGDSLTAAWTSDQIEKLIAVRTPTERQWARCPTYWAKSKTTEGKLWTGNDNNLSIFYNLSALLKKIALFLRCLFVCLLVLNSQDCV